MQENDEEKFSQEELCGIVKQLIAKINALEQQVEAMKKWTEKERKKCNIIEWLNGFHTPEEFFSSWVRSFNLVEKHLELVFEHDYINGITYIIRDLLPHSSTESFPIRAFEQKQNRLFVYEKEGWRMLGEEGFEEFIDKLQLKLIQLLQAWHGSHKKMINNEETNDVFFTNNIKVMGGKRPRGVSLSQIKHNLYAHLKYNLLSITEYQFVF